MLVSTKKANALSVKFGTEHELMVNCLVEVGEGVKDGICT